MIIGRDKRGRTPFIWQGGTSVASEEGWGGMEVGEWVSWSSSGDTAGSPSRGVRRRDAHYSSRRAPRRTRTLGRCSSKARSDGWGTAPLFYEHGEVRSQVLTPRAQWKIK
jgi:hypothetical protein